MTIIAACLVGALVVTVMTFGGLLRSERRQHARERDLLLNQLLHTVGKPWQEAPADHHEPPVEREPRTWTASPEQLPTY